MYVSMIPHFNFDFTMNTSKENMEGDKNYIKQSYVLK